MTREKAVSAIGTNGKRRARSGRKVASARGDAARISSDLVLLGALMVLASKDAGSASVLDVPAPVNESIDSESFGHAMQAMSGQTSEILMLATLAEDMHRSLAGSFKAAQTRFDVPVDPQSIAITQSKYVVHSGDPLGGESLRLPKEGKLGRAARSDSAQADVSNGGAVVQEVAKADKTKPIKKQEKNYKETADKMREASEDFLESMRKLFDEELEDLVARQEDGAEDIKVADRFSPSWLSGLLALGGGGGGGGGGGILGGAGGGFFGGFGIDGYVANATVFWDKNSNFVLDAGEISTTTDATGYYALNGVVQGVGQIVMTGGVDTSTGGSVGMMAASTSVSNTSAAMVTPLTLLMAQGMSESDIKAALEGAVSGSDLDGISLANYDPISFLEAATGDTTTAGAVLLVAQQIFAVVNAVAALAESTATGNSAAEISAAAQLSTLSALKSVDLRSLVGSDGGDATVIANFVKSAAPTFSDLSADVATAIRGVNGLIGTYLAAPSQALNADVRAAALVSQNDLVTQFKAIAVLDPNVAAAQITSKLSVFKDADTVKANFANVYQELIAAQSTKSGGVITGVDDVSLVVDADGINSFSISTLLSNDVNRAAGTDLVIVGIEPVGLSYDTSVVAVIDNVTAAVAQETTIELSGVLDRGDRLTVLVGDESITVSSELGGTLETLAEAVATQMQLALGDTYLVSSTGTAIAIRGPEDGSKVSVKASFVNAGTDNTQSVVVSALTEGRAELHDYAYEFNPSTFLAESPVGYIKLALGPYTVVARLGASEDMASLAEKLNTLLESAGAQDWQVVVEGETLRVSHTEGKSLASVFGASVEVPALGVAEQSQVFNVSLDEASVAVDAGEFVGQGNLRYYVANGNGVGSGIVRLSISPQTQTLSLSNADASVAEDSDFSLGDRLTLSNTPGSAVQTAVVVKLVAVAPTDGSVVDPENTSIYLTLDDERWELELGKGRQLAEFVPAAELPALLQRAKITLYDEVSGELTQKNFHGTFKLQYALLSEQGVFNAVSTTAVETFTIVPTSEFDTPTLKLSLGDSSFGDVQDAVVPATLVPTKVVTFKLEGGDRYEARSFTINNLSEGLVLEVTRPGSTQIETYTVGASGSISIKENQYQESISVKFKASQALLDTEYGLSDPVTVTVTNKDLSGVEISGTPQTFQIDVGGTHGLTVLANAQTSGLEDVAALIGALDVASWTPETYLVASIKFYNSDFQILRDGAAIENGSYPSGSIFSVVRTVLEGSVTYTIRSANTEEAPGQFLDDLTALSLVPNFKGTVAVSASVSAYDASDAEKATVSKDLAISFAPVADSVTMTAGSATLIGIEDQALSLQSVMTSANFQLEDDGEELHIVVRDLQSGVRIIDGSLLEGLTGAELKAQIAAAPSIGILVGTDIELSREQALSAVLVAPADGSLETDRIQIVAYSTEPGTSLQSEETATFDVDVSFEGVADGVLISQDSYASALVNTGTLKAELLPKTQLSVPINASLLDTDGSEAIWVRLSVQDNAEAIGDFSFSGASSGVLIGNEYVLKGSDLRTLRIESDTAFSGFFEIDIASIEGTVGSSQAAKTLMDAKALSTDMASVHITSTTLEVKFLQPASIPTISFESAPSYSVWVDQNDTYHTLDFKLAVVPVGDDKVTVLMTGVPSHNGTPAKFWVDNGSTFSAIGAAAEVSGIWVFNAADFGSASDPVTVRMVLPSGFSLDDAGKFDVTAFAVDSLGLTNAKSAAIEAVIPVLTVPEAAADPIIIDTSSSDGTALSLVGTAGGVAFDIDENGATEQLGWLSGGSSDDAFLVLGKADETTGAVQWKLITEYLDENADTNAVVDLKALAGADGILTQAELLTHGYRTGLWFDSSNRGTVDSAEVSELRDFTVNLANFVDTSSFDPSGALIAGSISAGGMTGKYTKNNTESNLSTATLYDVFLPVETSAQISHATLAKASIAGDEDSSEGILISEVLQATGDGWTGGLSVAGFDLSSANVLLSIRAKTAGAYFNLSQGARLDGQPTDTWLVLWNPSDKNSLNNLRLFTEDNFSGTVPLEFRATVIYNGADGTVSRTVARDADLVVNAVAERPDVSQATSTVLATEKAITQSISLKLAVSSSDSSETQTIELTPTSAIPSGTQISFNGGTPVVVVANQKLSFSGVFSEDSLQLLVPAYASGDFRFSATAISRDGTATKQVENIIVPVSVQAVAQASTMVVAMTSPATATENAAKFGVRLTATLADTDGSEEFTSVRIRLTTTTPLNGNLPSFENTSAASGVATSQFRLVESGVYELVVPRSGLTATGSQAVVTGNVLMPATFDGRFNLQANASSIEKSQPTSPAHGAFVSTDLTVAPVADGFALFETKSISVVSGDFIALGNLIKSMSLKDADESVALTFSNIPSSANLFYMHGGIWTPVAAGATNIGGMGVSFSGTGATRTLSVPASSPDVLNKFALSVGTTQPNFSLGVSAVVSDDAALGSSVQSTVAVQVIPQLPPTLLPAQGSAPIQLAFNEGGTGQLSLIVKTGEKLYPTNVEVAIKGVPAGVSLALPGASAVVSSGLDQTFVFKASDLSRGLTVTATPSFNDFSGVFDLSLRAVADYGVGSNGQRMQQVSVSSVPVTVNPVTDGVVFKSVLARDEGATWKVADILSPKDADGSERIDSLKIKEIEGLEVWVGSTKQSFTNGWLSVGATDVEKLVFKAADQFKGKIDLQIEATSIDSATIAGSIVSGKPLVESKTIQVNIAEVPSSPAVGLSTARSVAGLGDGMQVGLTDLVRVSRLSDTQVLELVGLNSGVRVLRADGTEVARINLRTNDGAPLSAVRLSASEFAGARLSGSSEQSLLALSAPLAFAVRVGTVDGPIGSTDPEPGVRYAYSKLSYFSTDLRNVATSESDYLVASSEAVDGGRGDDIVVASATGALLSGGDGKDVLIAGQDMGLGVVVDLGLGKLITVEGEGQSTALMRDISGFEVVVGSSADDILAAASTAVTLRGGEGSDQLIGGAGDDVLEGGSGDDYLSGNGGSDKFVLARGSGKDVIEDFTRHDVVVLAGFGMAKDTNGTLPSEVTITAEGEDWIITLQTGESLRLKAAVPLMTESELGQLITFDDKADLAGADPFSHLEEFEVPIQDLVTTGGEGSLREAFFGKANDFSHWENSESDNGLDQVLGVIADANLGVALAVSPNSSVAGKTLLDMTSFVGLAGSVNDDVLFGSHDRPSVLYGGSGGRDVLAGGSNNDVLITTATKLMLAGTVLGTQEYTDHLTGGAGADTFVIDKDAPWEPPTVEKGLAAIYSAKTLIADFNRAEGDRILSMGYSTEDIQIGEVNTNSNQQSVTFGGSLTVVFDLSFAREFDSNFTLRMSDFDRH
ncbi:RTX calcium-binding nonapeptide repeat [Oxalobacteraceae bacterium]